MGPGALFITGFVQVAFVSLNTYFLATVNYRGVLGAAFMISLIWSFNVKRVSFGRLSDRLIYAAGASLGSVFGLWASVHLTNTLFNR